MHVLGNWMNKLYSHTMEYYAIIIFFNEADFSEATSQISASFH